MSFLIVPATLTSPLDAVNTLIGSLGEVPVTSTTATSESAEALSRINEVDLEVQSRGWHWNREDAFTLSLAGDGTVALPDETLRVVRAYWTGVSSSQAIDVVQRGTRLYDRENHTFVFTAAPTVDLIVRLDWDSLPQAARSYITLQAAQRFHAFKQGSNIVLQINAQDVTRALATLEHQEDEYMQNSTINGNSSVVSKLYGLAGLRRLRGGY